MRTTREMEQSSTPRHGRPPSVEYRDNAYISSYTTQHNKTPHPSQICIAHCQVVKRKGGRYRRTHASIPAAFSMLSNLTQFWSAKSTLSCITSLTLSTLRVTDASLSISFKLSYFWQIFCSREPQVLSRDLSFAFLALSPALAMN